MKEKLERCVENREIEMTNDGDWSEMKRAIKIQNKRQTDRQADRLT